MERDDWKPGDLPEDWAVANTLAELGVLTASLLHELRQPVFAIKALAQVLRAEADGADGARLDQLLAQVEHVEALLGHYGSLGPRRGGQQVAFDLRAPVEAALEMLSFRARGLSLVSSLPPRPVPVRGRPTAARQVVLNLVQNALDAVADVPGPRVELRLTTRPDVVRIEVVDNGRGLHEGTEDRIFDPFFTTKPPERGHGLGLYIARQLLDEVEGDLEVRARREGGVRAVVTWPLGEGA